MQPNGQGNAISIYVENSGNINWLPGEEHTENYSIILPKFIAKGQYSLKAKLVYKSPEGPEMCLLESTRKG